MTRINTATSNDLSSLRPDNCGSGLALAGTIAGGSRPVGEVAGDTCTITAPDPVFAQIEAHRALRSLAYGKVYADNDPLLETVCQKEEQAIQALADTMPTSVAGVAALLEHMLEVEGFDATADGPLIRSIHSAAKALAAI